MFGIPTFHGCGLSSSCLGARPTKTVRSTLCWAKPIGLHMNGPVMSAAYRRRRRLVAHPTVSRSDRLKFEGEEGGTFTGSCGDGGRGGRGRTESRRSSAVGGGPTRTPHSRLGDWISQELHPQLLLSPRVLALWCSCFRVFRMRTMNLQKAGSSSELVFLLFVLVIEDQFVLCSWRESKDWNF